MRPSDLHFTADIQNYRIFSNIVSFDDEFYNEDVDGNIIDVMKRFKDCPLPLLPITRSEDPFVEYNNFVPQEKIKNPPEKHKNLFFDNLNEGSKEELPISDIFDENSYKKTRIQKGSYNPGNN